MINISYRYLIPPKKYIIIGILVIILLFITAQINYLLFHSIAEILFIITAALVYVLATKTYKYSEDNYLFFIGIGYFFIPIIHFFHLLTYKGMGVFTEFTANVPTQLWISARLMVAFTFVFALIFNKYKIRSIVLYVSYGLATIAIFLSIMVFENFPACYIPGIGLTPFKVGAEYAAMLLLAISLVIIWFKQNSINPSVRKIITASTVVMIFESLSFTLYSDVYGIMNFTGHILGIVATGIIYKGIVLRGIEMPYDLIFTELVTRNDELKKMSQYKSEFLASMSHEMRTPLTTVIALTDDLLLERQGALTEEQEDSLRDIRESSRELTNLINDLLDMAKIETDRMFLVLTDVDIGSVVCETERQLRPLALHNNIDIRVLVKSRVRVIADREKVKRVVQNILVNAIKFTPEGGSIEINVSDNLGESTGTLLRIKDTGIGIPKKDQELIFESFFQVERGLNKKFSGTGLGLALVKKIMDLHKGWAKLESEEGKGSTFEVFWPKYPHIDEEFE